jgi:hypothetical protein
MFSLKEVRPHSTFASTRLEPRSEGGTVKDRTRGKIPRSKQRPLKDTYSNQGQRPRPLSDVEQIVDSFELEKFQWITASTHDDGTSYPEDGCLFEYFVYNMLERWYSRSTPYVNGLPQYEHIETDGDEVFLTVSAVRDRYLQILTISNVVGHMLKLMPGSRTIVWENSEVPRLVNISPGILKILRSHHQFKQLCERWEVRGYVLELVSVDRTSVEVTLRPQTNQERLEYLDRQNAKRLESLKSRSFWTGVFGLIREFVGLFFPSRGS